MDSLADIRDDQTVVSTFSMSGTSLLAIRDILSAIMMLIPDRVALRRGSLGRLRQIASLFVFALALVERFALAWRERLAATTLEIVAQTQRHLHHPPQSWAAP